VITVPAVSKKRYYSVQLIDGNTYNYGYIGSRATASAPGNYLIAGPDWKGATPPGIDKVFNSTTPFSDADPDPVVQSSRHAQCREGSGGLQGPAAFSLPPSSSTGRGPED
jgi:hypothetical protein